MNAPVIHCATCTRTTTDVDKWDPEAETGIVYCDECWPKRPSQASAAPVITEALNEAYNTATRTTLAASDAVRAAESALARAKEAQTNAEATRAAIIAVIQEQESKS